MKPDRGGVEGGLGWVRGLGVRVRGTCRGEGEVDLGGIGPMGRGTLGRGLCPKKAVVGRSMEVQ